jgi:hypothetical protein
MRFVASRVFLASLFRLPLDCSLTVRSNVILTPKTSLQFSPIRLPGKLLSYRMRTGMCCKCSLFQELQMELASSGVHFLAFVKPLVLAMNCVEGT